MEVNKGDMINAYGCGVLKVLEVNGDTLKVWNNVNEYYIDKSEVFEVY